MKDNFSEHAKEYAVYRPSHSEELLKFILEHVRHFGTAWDCGTGNGQVAIQLSKRFKKVYATDLSEQQLANAILKKNITYKVMKAEEAEFDNIRFDLITVGQAIHWFDFKKFYPRVHEYLEAEGIFAAFAYDLIRVDSICDPIIQRLYSEILEDYWDEERKYFDSRYQSIPFPFSEISAPEFSSPLRWSFDHLIGYLNTWSAVQHFIRRKGRNPLDLIHNELKIAWGRDFEKVVYFPEFLRLGKRS